MSDWDLLVVVPDDTSDEDLAPLVPWRLQRESGVRADVIPCRLRDFLSEADTVNTLAYSVRREGIRIDGG